MSRLDFFKTSGEWGKKAVQTASIAAIAAGAAGIYELKQNQPTDQTHEAGKDSNIKVIKNQSTSANATRFFEVLAAASSIPIGFLSLVGMHYHDNPKS
ncbi:MAG TPA: hypothetical protein VMR41_00375 [Patescibacteria group bacterium]|nr:hypothetical protein [Patescibacteria group bacterium]